MRITHFGHAALLLDSGPARILIDPGAFSSGLDGLRDLDGILVSHQHGDHFDQPTVARLLQANPNARLYVDESAFGQLIDDIPAERAVVARPGETLEIGEERVAVDGGDHAQVHPDVPQVPNLGFYVESSGFYHPGDDFRVPARPVKILALPISGPWQGLREVVDYLRAVAPDVAIPVHEAVLAKVGLYHDYLERLKPEGTVLTVLEQGTATEL